MNADLRAAEWPFRIVGPVTELVQLLAEEMEISGMTKRAVIVFENSGVLLQVAQLATAKYRNSEAARGIRRLLADSPYNSKWAKSEREGGFPAVHRHSFVAMWAFMEAALEDTLVEMLREESNSVAGLLIAMNKAVANRKVETLAEDDARRLCRQAERIIKSAGDTWCERQEALFRAVGLDLKVEPSIHAHLEELNALRNCLLHRGGRIDSKAAERAPSLRPFLGRVFELDEPYHLHAYDVIAKLTVGVSKATSAFAVSRATSGGLSGD